MDKPVIEKPSKETFAQMKKVEQMLKELKWPSYRVQAKEKSQNRANVVQGGKAGGEGKVVTAFAMGKVRHYFKTGLVDSQYNKKFPELYRELRKLVRIHNPSFRYSSIQLNCGTKTAWHYDKNNKGLSYCLGLGSYTGGGVDVKQDGKVTRYNNNGKFLKYSGCGLEHRTAPGAKGLRYALIFYNRK